MKNAYYKAISRLIIFIFLFYWLVTILLTLSVTFNKTELPNALPRLNKLAGQSWPLFAHSINYNDRLYIMLRNKNTKTATDTLEILKNISYQKLLKAPFNHSEFIIDRLLNHYVTIIKVTNVSFLKTINGKQQDLTDSISKAKFANAEKGDFFFQESISTINNYCKWLILSKGIDTTGKEFKIEIKAENIQPFAQRKETNYPRKETLYFESFYNSF